MLTEMLLGILSQCEETRDIPLLPPYTSLQHQNIFLSVEYNFYKKLLTNFVTSINHEAN